MSFLDFLKRVKSVASPSETEVQQFIEELKTFYSPDNPNFEIFLGALNLDKDIALRQQNAVLSNLNDRKGIYTIG